MGRDKEWIIYGATGFTGRLVAQEAVRRGLHPILAGRDAERVGPLASSLGLAFRAFALDDSEAIRRGLAGTDLVLHCAGPFARTSQPLVKACLATGTSYLDITGEITVFERTLALDRGARAAGIVLLPGVGFDVVPSDCLAARLVRALPSTTHLDLAFASSGGGWSAGTVKTAIESLPTVGAIRRDGRIVPVPAAWEVRELEFSFGRRMCTTVPWGDVSTAYHTTGVPNIRVFAAIAPKEIARLKFLAPFLPLAALGPVKRTLQWWVGRHVVGPDAAARGTGRTSLLGHARNGVGQVAVGTVDTPEAYSLTAVAAVESAVRVLAGRVEAGAWTPARAFGPDFAGELAGVEPGPVTVQSRGEAGDPLAS